MTSIFGVNFLLDRIKRRSRIMKFPMLLVVALVCTAKAETISKIDEIKSIYEPSNYRLDSDGCKVRLLPENLPIEISKTSDPEDNSNFGDDVNMSQSEYPCGWTTLISICAP
jgi:hypothetical protein